MELALVENLQRQDLNPMEEAMGFKQLMEEYGLTQEQVSEQVSKSRSAVANALRLLNLPSPIAQLVTDGKLSAGHARAIMVLKSEKQQEIAARKIISLELSVRQAETMCKNMAKQAEKEETPKAAPLEVDYVAECEKTLSKCLNRGVKITRGKRKGKFELEFYGDEDLQMLYEALQTMNFRRS
jgi:ParB family chromosome partitioning protein